MQILTDTNYVMNTVSKINQIYCVYIGILWWLCYSKPPVTARLGKLFGRVHSTLLPSLAWILVSWSIWTKYLVWLSGEINMVNREIEIGTTLAKWHIWIFSFLYPGPSHLTPTTETTTPALIRPTPIAMVTNAPLRRPHHLHLDWVTAPGPSLHRITAKKATTVGITVKNLHRAGIAPGGEGKAPKGEREGQRRV